MNRYTFRITLTGGEQRRESWVGVDVNDAWQMAFAHLPPAEKERVRGFLVIAEEPVAFAVGAAS